MKDDVENCEFFVIFSLEASHYIVLLIFKQKPVLSFLVYFSYLFYLYDQD